MRTWRWYSKLLFALLVAASAYLVWPTPWRYHACEVADYAEGYDWGNGFARLVRVRENRFTGKMQTLHVVEDRNPRWR